MSEKPKQIIYLAQKYSGREAVSLAEALDYKWKLEAQGFTPENGYVVFSPIINSALEDWCKNPNFISALHNIFEGLSPDDTFDPTLVVFMNFIHQMRKVKANIMPLDYVAYDLALLQSWLKQDNTHTVRCSKKKREYDSGLLMAFCPSCFQDISHKYSGMDRQLIADQNLGFYSNHKCFEWTSKGAKTEFDFAKANYVECVLAESLYNGKRERI
jgi:hypothetical protein